MKNRTFFIGFCTMLVGGCDLIHTMLPRHGTTTSEARAALVQCGIVPDGVAWSVGPDGAFAFGRKTVDSPPMPESQSECLMRWVEAKRVKVAFIGWETEPR